MPFAAVAAASSVVTEAGGIADALGIKTKDALRRESLAASHAALAQALGGDRAQLAYMFDRRQHGPDGTRRGYWKDRLVEYYLRTGETRTALIDQLINTKVSGTHEQVASMIAQATGAPANVGDVIAQQPQTPSLLDRITTALSPAAPPPGTGQPTLRVLAGPALIALGVLAIAGALMYAGRHR